MQHGGRRIGRQLEGPVDRFGRPLFQAMSYYDAAEVLLQTMRFVDSTTGAGAESEYPVIAVNGIGDGVSAVPGGSAAPDIDAPTRNGRDWRTRCRRL